MAAEEGFGLMVVEGLPSDVLMVAHSVTVWQPQARLLHPRHIKKPRIAAGLGVPIARRVSTAGQGHAIAAGL